jgi:hypothetical protein
MNFYSIGYMLLIKDDVFKCPSSAKTFPFAIRYLTNGGFSRSSIVALRKCIKMFTFQTTAKVILVLYARMVEVLLLAHDNFLGV